MGNLDFSSWQAVITTLLGLVVVAFTMVGVRLLVMERVQQRRQRENRQINERLRTLIAAYKTLGGSFTGDLVVDPTHLRDVLDQQRATTEPAIGRALDMGNDPGSSVSSERARRIRDAVEAALSDIILLGNEEQVRLAASAATDLVAGRAVRTDALVVALRDFIRQVLDLEPVPTELAIPRQGPTRPGSGSGAGKDKGGATGGGRGGGDSSGAGTGGAGGRMGMGGIAAEDDERRGS